MKTNLLKLAGAAALLAAATIARAMLAEIPLLSALESLAPLAMFGAASILDLDFTRTVSPFGRSAPTPAFRSAFHGLAPVDAFTIESWFPKALKARVEEFNKLAAKSRETRAKFDADREEKANADVMTVELHNEIMKCGDVNRVIILQAERPLNEQALEIEAEIYESRAVEAGRWHGKISEAEEIVGKRLSEIGYKSLPLKDGDTTVKGYWHPLWVATHPMVCEARDRAEALRIQNSTRDMANAITQRIKAIEKTLTAERDRALAVAD